MSKKLFFICAILCFTFPANSAGGETIAQWDFSQGTHGWMGNARVADLSHSTEGLTFKSIGEDPWIEGPAVDLPEGKMFRVTIRMRSDADRSGQLFYGPVFSEPMSRRFLVKNDNRWHDYSLFIRDGVGAGTRFRLDPCHGPGQITLAYIKIEVIEKVPQPKLKMPTVINKSGQEKFSVRSGQVQITHYGKNWGNFSVMVDNIGMGIGYNNELIGIMFEDGSQWLDLSEAKTSIRQIHKDREILIEATASDGNGGRWKISRRFTAEKVEGTIAVETEISVNKNRNVVRLPWLTLFSGVGTFGRSKHQGLFAGLEYLADEPSSSKADIITPEHVRRIPDGLKVTFPLMAIEHEGRYVGLVWERHDMIAAEFDSPDRIYKSGGHLMGLSAHAVGPGRFENEFAAYEPITIQADKPLRARVMIIAGNGDSIVEAVKHYLSIAPLPELSGFQNGFSDAVKLLAHGWLDSAINEDWLFRHAVWGDSFGAVPAADAAVFMDWLANHTEDTTLQERLNQGRDKAIARLPAGEPFSSGVSHVRFPIGPLVFGRVDEYVQARKNQAHALLREFDENGLKVYRPGNVDYGKTHFANHANGLAGTSLVQILEAATLCADKQLMDEAIELLDKQTRLYANTVPRGAQTWEVPLHTPDILASGHMVKAYLLGYIISGRREHLEQARYWAWTGLPFVYLDDPSAGQVGEYATIAVYGATNWEAPVWFGLPVQWCGLVYASALYQLAEHDDSGPWQKISKGITLTGLQMTWPESDRQRLGLLPDIYNLQQQHRDGPAINPGTVGAHIGDAYRKGKMYDMKRLKDRGWFIHAPCEIRDLQEGKDSVSMKLDGWGNEYYYVLISGLEEKPAGIIARRAKEQTGRDVSSDVRFYRDKRYMTVRLEGKSELRLREESQ
jgi:hypothetical protein